MKQHIDSSGAIWGITPKLFNKQSSIDDLVHLGINKLKEEGFLNKEDRVILAGGAKVATNLSDEEASTNRVMGGIVEI